MGIISKIIGTSSIEGVRKSVESVTSLVDELTLTKEERAEFLTRINEAQTEINKAESVHRTFFVAGWRPAIGWVCAVSLACFFIPQYIVGTFLWIKTCLDSNLITEYPVEDKGLFELVTALLGMAGIRTIEKLKGKAK